MIATIEGVLTEMEPLAVVVEVHGIGYDVHVPVTTMEHLPSIGEQTRLYTHAVYREDSRTLYGFHARDDREFFRLLVDKVSGVGPKIALSILSKLSVPILRAAIAASDITLLSKCPGIGKKTAERLIIELRDHVGPGDFASLVRPGMGGALMTSGADSRISDAVTALVTLGYKPAAADKAVRRALQQLGPDVDTEAVIKKALG